MHTDEQRPENSHSSPMLRIAALALWLLPLIAMQFTDEVNWSVSDFVVFGIMLLAAVLTYERAGRASVGTCYRWAVGIAVLGSFLLVWISLGVSIIGRDGDPVNVIYAAVLAVGVIGAFLTGGRPAGMARVLIAMATVQALIALIAIFAGLGRPYSGPLELVLVNGIFVAIFLGSALLFRRAGEQSPTTS